MKTIQVMIAAVLALLIIASCGKKADTSGNANTSQTQQAQMPDTTTKVAQNDQATTPPVTEPEAKKSDTKGVQQPEKKADTKEAEKKVTTETKKDVPPPPVYVTLPESTQIHVKLIDSIDTDVHTTGTQFRALLAEPIRIDNKLVFEEGTAVTGVLDKVVESGHLKTPAELSFSLVSITDQNGNTIPIKTYSIDEKKGSHTGKDVGLIGGGAVVGGIIGKLTKKKGGTAIGAAAGAAAGAGVAAATGKQDIVHSAGTEATLFLKEPVKVEVKSGPFTKD